MSYNSRGVIHLEGVRELNEQLRRLPDVTQIRILKPAFLRAARYLVRAVRAAAPVGATKRLKRAVSAETPRSFSADAPYALVGFKRGGGRAAHLNEKGTRPRKNRKGANRGAMRANPFFTRSIAANMDGAINVLRIAWSSRLAIEAARIKAGLVQLNGRLVR